MFSFFNTEAIQSRIDVLLRYRWIGIFGYLLFLSPLLLLMLALLDSSGHLPDTFNYQGDSVLEHAFGFLLTLVVVIYFAASALRAYAKKQYLWLIVILFIFPTALLYLLFANTKLLRN